MKKKPESELDDWRERLVEAEVPIEAEINRPTGHRSLYFRDPAGNSVEIAVSGLWGLKEAEAREG